LGEQAAKGGLADGVGHGVILQFSSHKQGGKLRKILEFSSLLIEGKLQDFSDMTKEGDGARWAFTKKRPFKVSLIGGWMVGTWRQIVGAGLLSQAAIHVFPPCRFEQSTCDDGHEGDSSSWEIFHDITLPFTHNADLSHCKIDTS
jgi:hypothetical protein